MITFPTEQGVRTLVDEQLKNLDWKLTKGLPRNKLISFIITKNAHISSWMI